MVFNLGIGVKVLFVRNALAATSVDMVPERKLGKLSELLTPLPLPRMIAGEDFLRVSFLLRAAGRFLPDDFLLLFLPPLNRFLLPRGKNLPFLSLGSVLASFLPRATRLADFLLRLVDI